MELGPRQIFQLLVAHLAHPQRRQHHAGEIDPGKAEADYPSCASVIHELLSVRPISGLRPVLARNELPNARSRAFDSEPPFRGNAAEKRGPWRVRRAHRTFWHAQADRSRLAYGASVVPSQHQSGPGVPRLTLVARYCRDRLTYSIDG